MNKLNAATRLAAEVTASEATDVRGLDIKVGDEVARGVSLNRAGSVGVKVCKVTKVDGAKVYLDGSKVPMKYTGGLAVLNRK